MLNSAEMPPHTLGNASLPSSAMLQASMKGKSLRDDAPRLPPVGSRPMTKARESLDGFNLGDNRAIRTSHEHQPGAPMTARPSHTRGMNRNMSIMLRKCTSGVTLDDYEMIAVVGKGSTGRVWGARHTGTGLPVAVKILPKLDSSVSRVLKEREIMDKLGQHPYVVSLYAAFQTHESLIFVMRYAENGDLFVLLRQIFSEAQQEEDRGLGEQGSMVTNSWVTVHCCVALFPCFLQVSAAQIVLALEHIHSYSVCFRDLKPENVLVTAEVCVWLQTPWAPCSSNNCRVTCYSLILD